MTLKAFHTEQPVVVDGTTFRLVIDFRAIDAMEGVTGRSFDVVLAELQGEEGAKHGTITRLLWALTRAHHPELTLDEASSLQYGSHALAVGAAVQQLITNAFATGDDKPKATRPRKPRGASKPS